MNDVIGGSKGEHTPEPWRACGADRGGCTCGHIWSEPADQHVATATHSSQFDDDDVESQEVTTADRSVMVANAARIVACVNACAGIEDPAELRRQRDELLELVRSLEWDTAHADACPHCGAPDPTDYAGEPGIGHTPDCRVARALASCAS